MNGRQFRKIDIKAWDERLTQIPHEIADHQEQIRVNEVGFAAAGSQLAHERAIMQPMKVKSRALRAQINFLENEVEIAKLEETVSQQQAILVEAKPALSAASNAAEMARAAVQHTELLQRIKGAQHVQTTHPGQVASLQATYNQLSASLTNEERNLAAISLQVSVLRREIRDLEAQEEADRIRHQHEAYHSRYDVLHDHLHGHPYGHGHHHSHGHDHGHHHDHVHHRTTLLDVIGALCVRSQ